MKKKRQPKVKTKRDSHRALSGVVEAISRQVFSVMFGTFDTRLNRALFEIENLKAHFIALTDSLAENQMVDQDDFMKRYEQYMASEVGIAKDGTMSGRPILTLYNVE